MYQIDKKRGVYIRKGFGNSYLAALAEIEDRLREAFRTLARLPDREGRWLAPPRSGMPEPAPDPWTDRRERPRLHRPRPTPEEIDRMDEALSWLLALRDGRCRGIVMARAAGASWRSVSVKYGIDRRRAKDIYINALNKICIARENLCTKKAGFLHDSG